MTQRDLTSRGIQKDGAAFILAGVRLEMHPTPPKSPQDIAAGAANSGNPAGTSWTAQNFYFYQINHIKAQARQTGKDGFMPPAFAAPPPPATSATISYFNRAGQQQQNRVSVINVSPFRDAPVSDKQSFSVCLNALTTGGAVR